MGELLYSAAGFVVAIGVLVTVHEFGHFWVARRLGIRVLRFSVGFGKPLWMRQGRDGTEYVIAAIPLGGYVKMLDENEGDVAPEQRHRAFNHQPLWKRVAVVVAGPAFNFLFAIVAYWLVFTAGIDGLRPIVGAVTPDSIAEASGIRAGDEIVSVDGRENRTWSENRLYVFNQAFAGNVVRFGLRDPSGVLKEQTIDMRQVPADRIDTALYESALGIRVLVPSLPAEVGRVMEDSPAARSGLQAGDRVVAVDGASIDDWPELVDQVRTRPGRVIVLDIERDEARISIELVPEEVIVDGERIGRIGIERGDVAIPVEALASIRFGPVDAFWRALESTWVMSALTVRMLGKMLSMQISSENISGPITIAQYAGQSAQVGVEQFLMFLAVISISLGILNLLPIPVLDGGHLLYYLLEAVKGSPLSAKALMRGQQVGIVLLAALMSLAFYNDIVRLFQ